MIPTLKISPAWRLCSSIDISVCSGEKYSACRYILLKCGLGWKWMRLKRLTSLIWL